MSHPTLVLTVGLTAEHTVDLTFIRTLVRPTVLTSPLHPARDLQCQIARRSPVRFFTLLIFLAGSLSDSRQVFLIALPRVTRVAVELSRGEPTSHHAGGRPPAT
jgi:hypothetical protein